MRDIHLLLLILQKFWSIQYWDILFGVEYTDYKSKVAYSSVNLFNVVRGTSYYQQAINLITLN
jgi:hypothetical protein